MPSIFRNLAPLFAICAGPLSAAVVSSNNFESYAAGSFLQASATLLAGPNDDSATIVASTTAVPFGSGNKYVDFNGSLGAVSLTASGVNGTGLSTHHFDLYEPDNALTGSVTFGLGRGDLNNNGTTGATTAWSIDDGVISRGSNTVLASGALPVLSENRHYKAFVLYNGSASSANFTIPGTGTATLLTQQTALFFYDMTTGLYIDGGRYANDITPTDPNDTPAQIVPTTFRFRAFTSSSGNNELYIDNFTRDDTLTLAIPEPSVLWLGLLGFAGMLRRTR